MVLVRNFQLGAASEPSNVATIVCIEDPHCQMVLCAGQIVRSPCRCTKSLELCKDCTIQVLSSGAIRQWLHICNHADDFHTVCRFLNGAIKIIERIKRMDLQVV